MIGRHLATATAIMLAALGAVGCASIHEARTAVVTGSETSPDAQPPTSNAPSGSPPAVPEYLRAACGHPGAQVRLPAVPITIPRDECDLTGVAVLYGLTGVTVPSEGGVQAFADFTWGAAELSANVDPTTGDVTFQ